MLNVHIPVFGWMNTAYLNASTQKKVPLCLGLRIVVSFSCTICRTIFWPVQNAGSFIGFILCMSNFRNMFDFPQITNTIHDWKLNPFYKMHPYRLSSRFSTSFSILTYISSTIKTIYNLTEKIFLQTNHVRSPLFSKLYWFLNFPKTSHWHPFPQ